MNRFFLLAFLAFALAACQTPEPVPVEATPVATAVDAESDREALAAIVASYQAAIRTGDHATISALYADDAVIQPANRPPEQGRDALDAFFEATDSEPQEMTFTTDDLTFSASGDMAYEVGTTTGPDWTGKYLTVYRKADGAWHIVADAWSADAPPTPDDA